MNHHSFEEARGIKEQCAVSKARIHWVNTLTIPFDPTFESGRRRKARGAPLFNDEDLNDVNPSTDPVAFDTLLQDESLSEDVREIMRMKHE